MLREIVHVLRHAPATLLLKARLDQVELYQTLMRRADAAGLAARRDELVRDLAGEVLEIGCGTGLMFAHYPRGVRLTAIEPDRAFLKPAREAAAVAPVPVRLGMARAEALPFANGRFDAGVIALVLCTVRDVAPVLAEVKRLLKPGAALRLVEHVRSEGPAAGVLMDIFNPLWRWVNGQGCNMNRRPVAALAAAGFRIDRVEPFQLFVPGLPPVPFRVIRAVRP